MIELTVFIFLLLKVMILNWNTFCYKNIKTLFSSVLSIFKRFLGWKQKILYHSTHFRNKLAIPNHILYISNHVSLVDFFHFIEYFQNHHPEHHIILVTKQLYSKIPIMGKIIKNNCILLQSDFKKDEIEIKKSITQIKNTHSKTITLFFPEGKIYNQEAIDRSNAWCDKLNINRFNNVLSPHYKGLYYLIKYYKPEQINMCLLKFDDDVKNKKGKEFYQYITGYIPRESTILIKPANKIYKYFHKNELIISKNTDYFNENTSSNLDYFQKKFYKYWRNIDRKLERNKIISKDVK